MNQGLLNTTKALRRHLPFFVGSIWRGAPCAVFVVFITTHVQAQQTGGVGSAQEAPKEAKVHELQPTILQGDVDLFTGRYSASYPLGSVSTPGGLSYSLSLDYSPTFVSGGMPGAIEGGFYGMGWDVSVPTITISNAFKFAYTEAEERAGHSDCQQQLSDACACPSFSAVDPSTEGDAYWYAPYLSIPGVASGLLVFKEQGNEGPVFVLHKFESYVEAVFQGGQWVVTTADGRIYTFEGHVTTRMPNNKRASFYTALSDYMNQPGSAAADVQRLKVLGAITPRMNYVSWTCTSIDDPLHLPGQRIYFEYETYGRFDYNKELQQDNYSAWLYHEFKLNAANITSFVNPWLNFATAVGMQDFVLKKVHAWTVESSDETLELNYEELTGIPGTVPVGEEVDFLYRKEIVESIDGSANNQFTNWARFPHQMANDVQSQFPNYHTPSQNDPYRNSISGNYYRYPVADDDRITFDHSFLESPPLGSGHNFIPGDLYEIRTSVVRGGSNDPLHVADLDIQLVEADSDFPLHTSGSVSSISEHDLFNDRREIFSTFDRAVKWNTNGQTGTNITVTSNLFTMSEMAPVPINYNGQSLTAADGVVLRIGPANSDIDYSLGAGGPQEVALGATLWPSAYKAYSHFRNFVYDPACTTGKKELGVLSHDPIPHRFGIGLPWAMLARPRSVVAFSGFLTAIPPAHPSEGLMFKFWYFDNVPWSTSMYSWENVPTLMGSGPTGSALTKVELIHYAKKPMRLASVSKIRRNGETVVSANDAMQLISETALTHEWTEQDMPALLAYRVGEPPIASSRHKYVIQLTAVEELPVDPTGDGVATTSHHPKTLFEYAPVDDFNDPTLPALDEDYDCTLATSNPVLDPMATAMVGGALLSKVISPMGQRTSIVYNDMRRRELREATPLSGHIPVLIRYETGNGFQEVPNNYCDDGYMFLRSNIAVTPTVKQIKRSGGTTEDERVTDYEYADKIWAPKRHDLADDHYRVSDQGTGGNQYGYKHVTVTGPALDANTRTTTEHYFLGGQYGNLVTLTYTGSNQNTITITDVAGTAYPPDANAANIDDYLLFGKLARTEERNAQGDLLSKHETDWEASLAYMNGEQRPAWNTVGLLSFDYIDMDPLFNCATCRPGISQFEASSSPWKGAAYLSLFDSGTPAFAIEGYSYFIKKRKETNTEYDLHACVIPALNSLVLQPVEPGVLSNPNGSGYTNTAVNSNAEALLSAIAQNGLNSTNTNSLVASSPLQNNVLNAVFNAATIATEANLRTILRAQPALNEAHLISATNSVLTPASLHSVLKAQPYLTDGAQVRMLQRTTLSSDVKLELLLAQRQLSTAVMQELVLNQRMDAASTVKALEMTPQFSFALQAQLRTCWLPAQMKARLFSMQPSLSPSVISSLCQTPTQWPFDAVETVLKSDKAFLGNNNLLSILSSSTPLPSALIRNVVMAKNNGFNQELKDGILNCQWLNFEDQALLGRAVDAIGLQRYCGNSCVDEAIGISTVQEYSYFEANEAGLTTAEGFKKLFGLENASSIQLKWEPSWMLYSTKTYSPQSPGAYTLTENFYYQDLRNRYDRHWSILGNEPGFFALEPDPQDYTFGIPVPTTIFNGDPYELPMIEPLPRMLEFQMRTAAIYQQRSSTNNNTDVDPVVRNTFHYYGTHWNEQLDMEYPTVPLSPPGLPCPPGWNDGLSSGSGGYNGAGAPSAPGVYQARGFNSQNWQLLTPIVPAGYVLVRSNNGTGFWFVPVAQWDDASTTYTSLFINPEPTNSNNGGGGPLRYLVVAEFLKKAFQLKRTMVQADGALLEPYVQKRYFEEAQPLMHFEPIDEDQDIATADEWIPVVPHPVIDARTVLERNPYQQVQLEENERGLRTRYNFVRTSMTWYSDNANPCNSFQTWTVTDPGLPHSITIGFGRADAFTTTYTYKLDGSLATVTDPNSDLKAFTYDGFGRLFETHRNGKLLGRQLYDQLDNTGLAYDYLGHSKQNYVASFTAQDPENIGDPIPALEARSYSDPDGQTVNSISRTLTDMNTTTPALTDRMVSSGKVERDAWGRVVKTYKPYVYSENGTPFAFELKADVLNNTPTAHAAAIHENDQRSRPLTESKPGEDIVTGHTVKYRYQMLNYVAFACELGLSDAEALLFMPGNASAYRWRMVEVEDEDGRRSRQYSNALGQQVATQSFIDNQTEAITLFLYDSQGNLARVINPEKQHTTYEHNLLGWMFRKTTVDGGVTKYMFDKSGNVVLEQDANGRLGEDIDALNPSTMPTYRRYTYDSYNRLEKQERVRLAKKEEVDVSSWPGFNGPWYLSADPCDPLFYANNLVGADPVTYEMADESTYCMQLFGNASTLDWLSLFQIHAHDNSSPWNEGVQYFPAMALVTAPLPEKLFYFGPLGTTDPSLTGIPPTNYVNLAEQDLINNARSNMLGRLSHTITYGHNAYAAIDVPKPVQYEFFSYTTEGQVQWQLQQFCHNGIDYQAPGLLILLDHAKYDRRGNLRTLNIDVNADEVLDLQHHYTYDLYNRLTDVYASMQDNGTQGERLAHYDYDEARGLVTRTKYFRNCGQGNEVQVDELEYDFDVRDRLTDIRSTFFQHALLYDAQTPSYQGTQLTQQHNYNGSINGAVSTYTLGGALSPPSIFSLPTTYGYTYDGLNRLREANAAQGNAISGGQPDAERVGDEAYTYDRIGNITWLSRHGFLGSNPLNVEHHAWSYAYQPTTSRLAQVTALAAAPTRIYQYDAAGNLIMDNSRGLQSALLGRANLPFALELDNGPLDRHTEKYLYNSSDLRIYKEELQLVQVNEGGVITYVSTLTTSEFYLRDPMGREIGVLDMNNMTWNWYLFGGNRFARIRPTDDQQPAAFTSNLGQRGALDPNSDELTMLAAFLVSQMDENDQLAYPMNVVRLDRSPNLGPLFFTPDGYATAVATDPALESARTWELPIESERQQLVFTRSDQTRIRLSVQEVLDLGLRNLRAAGTYPPTYTTVANTDLASVTYYVHDHLGNSRVVYTPDPGCGVGGTTTYALDYVGDYFPYGKVLREAVSGPMEKYLTTHHQRDVETGLDYRGARYYDADVARFLSLDPLAADYASWSDYNYVLSEPISLIDPDGRSATKYEDEEGNVLGDDGVDNGITRTITKEKWSSITTNPDNLTDGNLNARGRAELALPRNSAFKTSDAVEEFKNRPQSSLDDVIEMGMLATLTVVADDPTGIGFADDVLIPIIVVAVDIYVLIEVSEDIGIGILEMAHDKRPKQSTGSKKRTEGKHMHGHKHGGKLNPNRPKNPNQRRGAPGRGGPGGEKKDF